MSSIRVSIFVVMLVQGATMYRWTLRRLARLMERTVPRSKPRAKPSPQKTLIFILLLVGLGLGAGFFAGVSFREVVYDVCLLWLPLAAFVWAAERGLWNVNTQVAPNTLGKQLALILLLAPLAIGSVILAVTLSNI